MLLPLLWQIAALHAESLSERFFVALERASSIHESTKTLLVEGDGFSRVRHPTGTDLESAGCAKPPRPAVVGTAGH